jgi:hypothetical protein
MTRAIGTCRLLRLAPTLVSFAMATAGGTRIAGGQSLNIPRGTSEATIVAAAEADGAAYPRIQLSEVRQTSPRTCVVGHELGPAASGKFTIGGNLSGSASMQAGRQGKIWWAPAHYAANMQPLVVRGRSLTTPSDTLRFTTSKIAWPVTPGAAPMPPADRKYFFPSGITIPHAGRWLLIATSGRNWGCFVVTVTRPNPRIAGDTARNHKGRS